MPWTPAPAIPHRRSPFAIVLAVTLVLVLAAPALARGSRGRFLGLINDARRQDGLHTISLDIDISHFAHHHSRVMARRHLLFHTTDLGQKLPRSWKIWGENVADGRRVHR